MSLHIVLLQPEIPQNTGNIARTCACIGASLHLVEPMGFRLTEHNIKRSGLDYWDKLDIVRYATTEEFLTSHADDELFFFSGKGSISYADVSYPQDAYLVFGRESRGIDDDVLAAHEDRCVRIPMRSGLRSLNLSNSVAIAAYEALRQQGFPELA